MSSTMDDIPKPGDPLRLRDVERILEALAVRQDKAEETLPFSLGVVLFNLGDCFTPITCVNGEWSGVKDDIPKSGFIPKCPNGHVMTEGKGVKLGWVEGD